MADIYIVYSSPNVETVRKLVDLLSNQWEVWWDDKIVGKFAAVIERELPNSKCVVPIWSSASRDSDMVRDEISLAKKLGMQMIPAKIDDCEAPYGFGGYSSVDLRGWDGQSDHPGFQQLVRRLASVVPPRAKPRRPLSIGAGRIPLPAVFLSVSSHETQLAPLEAMKALRLFGVPTVLISAYDMLPRRRPRGMLRELSRFRAQDGFVLINSGNYEASRRGDERWSPKDLKLALAHTPHDWAYCFDVMNVSKSDSRAVEQIVEAVQRDCAYTSAPMLPIVHARKIRGGGYDLDELPTVIRELANRLNPPLVSIPERELGPGLIARAKTVRHIREELDKLPFYQPLHLLGTGNPLSIAVLTAAGADSFDGLEWCRVAVDRDTGRLHHFQHFDFFIYQALLANSRVTIDAVNDERVDFAGKVAFHNLDFYASFTKELQQSAERNTLHAFVVGFLGKANTRQLTEHIPDLFQ